MSASRSHERLGDRALPGRRVLAHRDGDAVEPADRGAAQYVERADAGRGQDQTAAVRFGGGKQAVEQRIVGEGADGRDEQIGAAVEHPLAMRPHGLVARAFGDGVELVREEALGVVGEPAPLALIWARPLHQHRDELDILQPGRLDVLADGAVADETELHERRCSTQRAQAISLSSPRCGPTSCTDSGRPNGPVLNGRATQGEPRKVQKRLKIGSPVCPSPAGASPRADGTSRTSNLSQTPREVGLGAGAALLGVGHLRAGHRVAGFQRGRQAGRDQVREALALAWRSRSSLPWS